VIGQRYRNADKKKKERKHQISQSASIPFSMPQGWINILPRPGLLTMTMPAMVNPLRASKEMRRDGTAVVKSEIACWFDEGTKIKKN